MDSRRRTKVVVDDAGLFTSSNTVFQSLLLNVLFIVVAHIEKHLVSSQYGVHALLAKVMIGPSAVCLLWGFASGRLARVSSLKWSLVVFTSFCLYLKYVTLLQVLSTLSPLRVLLFIQYSPMLADSILKPSSKHRALLALSSLLIPFLFDILNARSDVWTTWTAYTIIAVQVMSSGLYEHARASMNIVVEDVIATALSIIGATLFTLLGCAPEIVLEHPLTTASSIPYHMSAGILLMVVLSHHPLLSSHANMLSSGNFVVSYILTIVSASIIGYVGFGESPTAVDIVTAICLFCGVQRSPATSGESPFTNVIRIARSYLNSILANSESRKIFYFLMLNMCYMLVQMLYGIWTNSLGLISDAIHMAFDCMAIGVGLVASVMARWPPNERYTYGSAAKLETLFRLF